MIAIEIHNRRLDSTDLGFHVDFFATQRGPYVARVRPGAADVVWYTQREVAGEVRYGLSPDNLIWSVSHSDPRKEHILTLSTGSPSAIYYYRVVSGNSEWPLGSFRSCGSAYNELPFTFLVYGDSGADGERTNLPHGVPGANQRAIRDLLEAFFDPNSGVGSTYGRPDFLLHTADVICDYPPKDWFDRQFFGFYHNVILQAPIYTSIGNHDAQKYGKANYLEAMVLPAGSQQGGERYYSFNWNNVHFFCLDTTDEQGNSAGVWDPAGPQAAWLEADLEAMHNRQAWIIVFFHHPPYADPPHDPEENVWQLRQLFDVFRAHHVDLVFAGHSHFYERTYALLTKGATDPGEEHRISDPLHSRNNSPGPPGTIFVTTGGGGRPLNDPGDPQDVPWLAKGLKSFHVVRVRVSGRTLRLTMIDKDGVARDTIVLTKPQYKFIRGDVNQDWDVDVTDASNISHYLFIGDYYGDACLDAFDANDDGALDITDPTYLFNYLFLGGPPPPAPFVSPYEQPDCGPDPTADALECEKFVPAEIPGDWQSGWAL